MTEITQQKSQQTTHQNQKLKREHSLLSKTDSYAIDLLNSTSRRETSMPGTSTKNGRTSPQVSRGKANPRHAAQDQARTFTAKFAPATVRLSEPAANLGKVVKPAATPKKRAGSKMLLAFIALCLFGASAAITLPRFTRIESVRISGLETLSEKAIVSVLGDIADQSLFALDLNAIEKTIQSNPRVSSAKACRILPSTLSIDIKERSAVASIAISTPQGSQLILVDGEGFAFAAIDAEDSRNPELPVVSGIHFEQFIPGQRMPDMLLPLFSSLSSIRKETPVLLKAFSEIKVEKISESTIELLLYPVHMKTAVRMPLRLDADALRNALVVLDILRSRGLGNQASEIDFQSGTVVYQEKEAVSG